MNFDGSLVAGVRTRLTSPVGRSFAWSMAAAVASRLGLLLLAMLLARRFGPAEYGVFTFATGAALLASQLAVLGWPMLMNRLIPGMMKDRDWAGLKGLRDAGDLVVVVAGLGAAALLLLLAWLSPGLATGFALGAALVIPFGFGLLRRQQLAAVRRPAWGLMMDQGFGAILSFVILLVIGLGSITEATLLFGGGVLLGIAIGTVMFRRLLPADVGGAARRVDFWQWMAIAFPMLVGMSAKLLMNKTDILMLAPLSDMHETGIYGAAFRITYLLTFPQIVMMSVITPMLSEAFAHGRMQQARRLVRTGLLFAVVTAVPTSIPLILFPETAMALLFGARFAEGAPVLVLLTIGQLAASLSIPFQSTLTMGGREKVYGTLNLSALAVHAVINLALIPYYGAVGAAVSTLAVALFLLVSQIVLNRPILARAPG